MSNSTITAIIILMIIAMALVFLIVWNNMPLQTKYIYDIKCETFSAQSYSKPYGTGYNESGPLVITTINDETIRTNETCRWTKTERNVNE